MWGCGGTCHTRAGGDVGGAVHVGEAPCADHAPVLPGQRTADQYRARASQGDLTRLEDFGARVVAFQGGDESGPVSAR